MFIIRPIIALKCCLHHVVSVVVYHPAPNRLWCGVLVQTIIGWDLRSPRSLLAVLPPGIYSLWCEVVVQTIIGWDVKPPGGH